MKKENIQDYLLSEGVLPHVKGFSYLTKAIEEYDPFKPLVKGLYHEIAVAYGSSPQKVERGIRHAIEMTGSTKPNGEYIAYAKIMIERMKKK